jgi:RHS repeat-associated protein
VTGSTTNSSYNEYVFFAGRRIAQSNPSSGNVYYYFVDHLGSTRVVTSATGTACYEVDYLPYGTENTPSGFSNTCSTRYRFTGYERDLETAYGNSAGNDYAFARYYNSRLGRFMSADPLDGDISDPQTLNKYAYVRDNPVNLVDPLGLRLYGDNPYVYVFEDLPGAGSACPGVTTAAVFGGFPCDSFRYNPPPLPPWLVPPPPAKPKPSTSCLNDLKTAGQNAQALDRASSNWVTLMNAANSSGISTSLLAAIGVRESGFRNLNENDGAGVGVGVFQITVSSKSGVTAAQAGNLTWAANYAANMLATNMSYLGRTFPNFTSAQLLQATAASYNFGTGNISGNPNTIDVGSAPQGHGNYGSNVLNITNDCFN